MGCRVAVDDVALHSFIQGGTVGDSRSAGFFGIAALGGSGDGFCERLQTALNALIARGQAHGFAGSFDCRLGIGHDVFKK